jgi:hypothetical protein
MEDGDTPIGIDAGFEIALGDASDVEVANAHAWGTAVLLFSDGVGAPCARLIDLQIYDKGIAFIFSTSYDSVLYSHHDIRSEDFWQ